MTDSVTQLHECITVTFSAETTKLIQVEIEPQMRMHGRAQTTEELVEEAVTDICTSMAVAIEWIEVRR